MVWDTRRPELVAEAVRGAGEGGGGAGGAPIHALCTSERGSGGEYRLLLADDSGSVMARGLALPASGAGGGLLSSGFLASPWAPGAARASGAGPRDLTTTATTPAPHCHISPHCALVNKAHTPLTGLTFISSGRQRQLGRSEGFALAAAPTGALECALLPGV